MQKYLVNFPFPGFYESALDRMIDDEIEQIFDTDGNGCNSNVPDDLYFKTDYSNVHLEQSKAYLEAWCEEFKNQTGIDLKAEYESYTSPREYNFETDRLFAHLTKATIRKLFAASEANNHVSLTAQIEQRFTSRSGFISGYSNDLGDWLIKPVLTWDHNELGTLLIAVLAIHVDADTSYEFDTYSLMESYQCNGNLSNDVWNVIPKQLQEFADIQREYGQAVDYNLWVETGKVYPNGTELTTEELNELPPIRCKFTIDLFTGV